MSKNEAPDLVQTNPIQFFHVNFETMIFSVQASVVASVVGDLVGAVINSGLVYVTVQSKVKFKHAHSTRINLEFQNASVLVFPYL